MTTEYHSAADARAAEAAKHDPALALLRDVLRPLRTHYLDPRVEEIAISTPGVVFRKNRSPDRHGRMWRTVYDPRLTHEYLTLALHTIANSLNERFAPPRRATLYSELPGNYRITAAAGDSIVYTAKGSRGGITLSIRQAPIDDPTLTLHSWSLSDTHAQRRHRAKRSIMSTIRTSQGDDHARLYEAAARGDPILFSGAMGSGKTTMMNVLIRDIHSDTRVIIVEDAGELITHVPNRLYVRIDREPDDTGESQRIHPRAIRNLLTRLTPEAIIIGEISTNNSLMAMDALKLGISHCWTSIHAASPEEALTVFADQIRKVDPSEDATKLERYLRSKFTVAQVTRVGADRTIEVLDPLPLPRAT